MKYILPLLLCAALLIGCEASPRGLRNLSPESPSTQTTATIPQGLYAPESAMERDTAGAVQVFPLPMADVYGLGMLGDDLLVFSGTDSTTLTRLTGPRLEIAASVTLDSYLSPEDSSLTIGPQEISFYQESTGQMVVLDTDLREIIRYPLPDTLVGKPLLSQDRGTLYYCTENAVMAWNLNEELHRTVKMMSYTQQTIQGLHRDGSVLQCRILDGDREETLFLSTETGQLLHLHEGVLSLWENSGFYFASFSSGMAQTLVFGTDGSRPFGLMPQDPTAPCTFLPQSRGAVTLAPGGEGDVLLQYYDLASGYLTASLSLPEAPAAIAGGSDGCPWLLVFDPEFGSAALYRWDCSGEAEEKTVYTGIHYTAENPDLEGLEKCRAYAARLSEKFGIQIRVWKDATAIEPWDYDLQTEYLVPVIQEELDALDRRLSHYPKSLLADTAAHFSSLSICLVRQLTGSVQSGSLDTAIGIQFLDGTDAYLVLAAGKYSEHSLYHEFFHLMETHILGGSSAFDRWEELNPSGFCYDYSYTANATRDSGVYLRHENRAFVDTYSMSFPKEDRARIMEYAMLPGNRELFRSPTLQRKLKTLCDGIREAYHLEKIEEPFLWEQYLE